MVVPINNYTANVGNLRGFVANVLDCDIVENKFEPQTRYYVHFLLILLVKVLNPLILSQLWVK